MTNDVATFILILANLLKSFGNLSRIFESQKTFILQGLRLVNMVLISLQDPARIFKNPEGFCQGSLKDRILAGILKDLERILSLKDSRILTGSLLILEDPSGSLRKDPIRFLTRVVPHALGESTFTCINTMQLHMLVCTKLQ